MKKQLSKLMIISVAAILAGCQASQYFTIKGSPYSLLNGKTAKKKYESLTTVGIASLNYLSTSAAQNASHFANFVDGLLTHSDFGTLELGVAESAKHNSDYTEFTFKIRDDKNLYWSTYENKPYKYNGQVQYVKAADFVQGAKIINTFNVGSDTQYLMRDFIVGAAEYFYYTEILDGIAQEKPKFKPYKDNPGKQAEYIMNQIQTNHPAIYEATYDPDSAQGGTPIGASDIPNIASGARLGVKANEATNEVTYSLFSSARYFPTLLTYSTYLPVNANFYEEKGAKKFGTSKDTILYCGPYVLSELDETNITYKANKAYLQRKDVKEASYKIPRIETVHYNIVKTEIDSTYIRSQFEAGNIDGFSLSPNDNEGWKNYVEGPDKSGSIEEPYSGLVNNRWLDQIGECYGSNIVMDRTKNNSTKKSYSTLGTEASVANTEKALRLQEVRNAILACIDYREYYSRYADGEKDDIFAVQRLVNTYVPKNFVMDDNGNEYTTYFYANELAANKGLTDEEAQALIEPGQYETRQLDYTAEYDGTSERDQIRAIVQKAVDAVNAYNANSTLTAKYGGQITFPINLEYYSAWDVDQETKAYDTQFINAMNIRLNDLEPEDLDGEDPYANCSIFKVIPTDKATQANYQLISGSTNDGQAAFDFSVVQWGWGADYGDPLTYMNTYTRGGDWGSVFYYVSEKGDGSSLADSCMNIRPDGHGGLEDVVLLEEYEHYVDEGRKQTDNLTERYTNFAKAEYLLINELGIYLPQVNYGQGWSLSVSKSAGYEMPTSNYGLSNDRMTGMYVLKEPLTRQDRIAIRAEQEKAKAKYLEEHDAYNIYND